MLLLLITELTHPSVTVSKYIKAKLPPNPDPTLKPHLILVMLKLKLVPVQNQESLDHLYENLSRKLHQDHLL